MKISGDDAYDLQIFKMVLSMKTIITISDRSIKTSKWESLVKSAEYVIVVCSTIFLLLLLMCHGYLFPIGIFFILFPSYSSSYSML